MNDYFIHPEAYANMERAMAELQLLGLRVDWFALSAGMQPHVEDTENHVFTSVGGHVASHLTDPVELLLAADAIHWNRLAGACYDVLGFLVDAELLYDAAMGALMRRQGVL